MKRWVTGLVFLLLASGNLFAETNWRAVEYFKLTGGLNDASDETTLDKTEASDLQNVTLTPFGGIAKREGFDNINTTTVGASATATGLAFYKQSDGDRFLVGTFSNGGTDTIQKMDYGGGSAGPDLVFDDVTGSLSLSFADDNLADFATAQDFLIIEDGVGTTPPYILSGAANIAFLLAGSPPNSTIVEFHKRHLWLAGLSTARSRVTFSNLDNVLTWTGTDTIEVETDDGQNITALKSALDCLYAFKDASIWRICGNHRDDFVLEQMVRGIGTLSNQSVVLINNQFVFFSQRGDIMVYDGGVKVETLSQNIEGTLEELNANRFNKVVAVAFNGGVGGDDNYYLCLTNSGSSTHDLLLEYDTYNKAWLKHDGINCNALTTYELGTQQLALAFADYAGFVHRYPFGDTDNGAAIAAYYETGQLALDIPQQKIFRLFQPIVRQETLGHELTFEYRIDFVGEGPQTDIELAGSGAQFDSAIYDTDEYADLSTTMANIHVDQVGNFIKWRVENLNASEPFLLRGVRLWYEPTSRAE